MTVQSTVSTVLEDAFTGATKSGPGTTEFWSHILAPIAAFVIAFLVAHGVSDTTASTLVSGLVALAAGGGSFGYARARAQVKSAVITAYHDLQSTAIYHALDTQAVQAEVHKVLAQLGASVGSNIQTPPAST